MKHRAECTTFLSLVQIYKQFLTPARKQGLQALQKTKLLTRCEDLPAKQSYALETIRLNKLPSQQNFTNSQKSMYINRYNRLKTVKTQNRQYFKLLHAQITENEHIKKCFFMIFRLLLILLYVKKDNYHSVRRRYKKRATEATLLLRCLSLWGWSFFLLFSRLVVMKNYT